MGDFSQFITSLYLVAILVPLLTPTLYSFMVSRICKPVVELVNNAVVVNLHVTILTSKIFSHILGNVYGPAHIL